MSSHRSHINWQHKPHSSETRSYSPDHLATLAGGQHVHLSSSPGFKGNPDCADPEQLLVTALASCHMLFFLAIAELKGYRVEQYQDDPVGHLEKDAAGRMALTRIELHPEVHFGDGKRPDADALDALHAAAHQRCFIAHSITARITIHPAAP
ncbi:MAG: OsmC family protein [Proteobacteria bacterium]|nr:OsmC family protein [Pseudomonadota bacterium]